MKLVGFLLLVGGFLAGAYSTALDISATNWTIFWPAAITSVLGLIVLKRQSRGKAKSTEVLSANKTELDEAITNIVTELTGIVRDCDKLSTDEIRVEIDKRLRDDLRRFAEARESMIHLFGIQTYADIMSEFAAGERNVNRVWSASTDGYRREAETYLQRACARFGDARQQLDAALARS